MLSAFGRPPKNSAKMYSDARWSTGKKKKKKKKREREGDGGFLNLREGGKQRSNQPSPLTSSVGAVEESRRRREAAIT